MQLGAELGEVPLHGTEGHSSGTFDLEQRD